MAALAATAACGARLADSRSGSQPPGAAAVDLQVPVKVVKREIDFSSTIYHDNIVRLLDVFAERQNLVIVWELISGPDLLDLLNEFSGEALPQ
jgi:serine/threonine protein kinase